LSCGTCLFRHLELGAFDINNCVKILLLRFCNAPSSQETVSKFGKIGSSPDFKKLAYVSDTIDLTSGGGHSRVCSGVTCCRTRSTGNVKFFAEESGCTMLL
jgi:hypothetical protein